MRIARLLAAISVFALSLAALAGCAHPPDNRSVQQAVDDAVAGG